MGTCGLFRVYWRWTWGGMQIRYCASMLGDSPETNQFQEGTLWLNSTFSIEFTGNQRIPSFWEGNHWMLQNSKIHLKKWNIIAGIGEET